MGSDRSGQYDSDSPGRSSDRDVRNAGNRFSGGVIRRSDGTCVVVCKPDHDFVLARSASSGGSEEVIRNIDDIASGKVIRP